MNFPQAGQFDSQAAMAKMVEDQRNIYPPQFGQALSPPPETLSSIQQDSIKCAYELCTLLDSIGDAISGSIPATATQPVDKAGTVKGSSIELRSLVQRALLAAQRIGAAL